MDDDIEDWAIIIYSDTGKGISSFRIPLEVWKSHYLKSRVLLVRLESMTRHRVCLYLKSQDLLAWLESLASQQGRLYLISAGGNK